MAQSARESAHSAGRGRREGCAPRGGLGQARREPRGQEGAGSLGCVLLVLRSVILQRDVRRRWARRHRVLQRRRRAGRCTLRHARRRGRRGRRRRAAVWGCPAPRLTGSDELRRGCRVLVARRATPCSVALKLHGNRLVEPDARDDEVEVRPDTRVLEQRRHLLHAPAAHRNTVNLIEAVEWKELHMLVWSRTRLWVLLQSKHAEDEQGWWRSDKLRGR